MLLLPDLQLGSDVKKDQEQEVKYQQVLIDFSLTVKAATLIFISGRGLAISSAKQRKSGSIYNLAKNKNELFGPCKRGCNSWKS